MIRLRLETATAGAVQPMEQTVHAPTWEIRRHLRQTSLIVMPSLELAEVFENLPEHARVHALRLSFCGSRGHFRSCVLPPKRTFRPSDMRPSSSSSQNAAPGADPSPNTVVAVVITQGRNGRSAVHDSFCTEARMGSLAFCAFGLNASSENLVGRTRSTEIQTSKAH